MHVVEVDGLHGLPDPVGGALCGDGETDVAECLGELCEDVVGPVFVAYDGNPRDAVLGDHASEGVGFRQERVAALKDALADAGGVAHPDGCPEDQDVCVEDPAAGTRAIGHRRLRRC